MVIDEAKPVFSEPEIVELILEYIHRDEEEVEELKAGKQVRWGGSGILVGRS